jgi:hypothetical protein
MFQPYQPPVLTTRLTGFVAEPAGLPHHQEEPSTKRLQQAPRPAQTEYKVLIALLWFPVC